MRHKFLAGLLLLFPVDAALAYYIHDERQRPGDSLTARLGKIVSPERYPEVSCAEIAAIRPLVLLVLGQSNAGNHGSPPTQVREPLTIVAEGKCLKATDPLLGATGTRRERSCL